MNGYGCAAKITEHLALLGKVDAAIANITDADEKAALSTWAKDMRAYLDAHQGVPGVGD